MLFSLVSALRTVINRRSRRSLAAQKRFSRRRAACKPGVDGLETRVVPATYSAGDFATLQSIVQTELSPEDEPNTVVLTADIAESASLVTNPSLGGFTLDGQDPTTGEDHTITSPEQGTEINFGGNSPISYEVINTIFVPSTIAFASMAITVTGSANVTLSGDTITTSGYTGFTTGINATGSGSVTIQGSTMLEGANTGILEEGTGAVNLVSPATINWVERRIPRSNPAPASTSSPGP